MQKRVSTLAGIAIIIAATIVLYGGAFTYQYYAVQNLNSQLQIQDIR